MRVANKLYCAKQVDVFLSLWAGIAQSVKLLWYVSRVKDGGYYQEVWALSILVQIREKPTSAT